MTPLGLVVAGFALVVLDFRFEGVDVAADVLGWLLAATGAWRMRPRSDWFAAATAAAAAGVALGVPSLVAEPEGLLRVATAVVETCFVFAVLSGVVGAARAHDQSVAERADLLRWIDLGLLLVSVPLLTAVPDPVLVLVLALSTLGVFAWILIFLLSVRERGYLQPPDTAPRAVRP